MGQLQPQICHQWRGGWSIRTPSQNTVLYRWALVSCRGLYLALNDWGERDASEYEVSVILVLDSNNTLQSADVKAAEAAHGRICAAFDAAGFDVTDASAVESTSDLTIADFILLSKWQLDYVTIRDNDGEHAEPISGEASI